MLDLLHVWSNITPQILYQRFYISELEIRLLIYYYSHVTYYIFYEQIYNAMYYGKLL